MSVKDDWPKEKNWKQMYTRSEKWKRAAQLGMAYPVVPEHKLAARHHISHADIDWADVILVMEEKHRQRIVAEYRRLVEHTPIHVLDIPDEYKYMDPELIDILEQTVEPLLFA